VDEIIPVILGAVLGAAIWRSTTGWVRLVLSVLAVLVSGAFATVMSGEYHTSWVYLLLDLGEAALGLAAGFFVAYRLLPARRAEQRPAAGKPGSAGGKR